MTTYRARLTSTSAVCCTPYRNSSTRAKMIATRMNFARELIGGPYASGRGVQARAVKEYPRYRIARNGQCRSAAYALARTFPAHALERQTASVSSRAIALSFHSVAAGCEQ